MDEKNKNVPGFQPEPPIAPRLRENGVPATDAEKNAVFSSAGGVAMIFFAIFLSASAFFCFLDGLATVNVFGLFVSLCKAAAAVGVWLTFVSAKRRKLFSKGLTLVRIPFVFTFAFTLIGTALHVTMYVVYSFEFLPFLFDLMKFILNIIYFVSVDRLLRAGVSIEKDVSVRGKISGSFTAIATVIFALISFAGALYYKIAGDALLKIMLSNVLPLLGLDGISAAGSGVAAIGYVAVSVELLAGVYAAAMIVNFNKKLV